MAGADNVKPLLGKLKEDAEMANEWTEARPTPARVHRRAEVARAVVARALASPDGSLLSRWMDNWRPNERAEFLEAWRESGECGVRELKRQGLWPEATPVERHWLNAAPEEISEAERQCALWRAEAAGVLLWALGCVDDLPSWTEPFSFEALEGLEAYTPETATLRSRDELVAAYRSAHERHEETRTPTTKVPSGAVARIARERLRALKWVTGRAPHHSWEAAAPEDDR